MEFALVNRSQDRVVAAELPWAARACNRQHIDHILPAYSNWFRRLNMTLDHWPVVGYASLDGLEPSTVTVCLVLDQIARGELGDHSSILGLASSRALAQGAATSITVSHEAAENRADPACDLWIKQPDGSALAHEICDAVESTDYPIDVEILGIQRTIRVSNFVLPAWFLPGAEGPYDFMGLLQAPGAAMPGCHVVKMMPDKSVTTTYGQDTSPSALSEKFDNPLARTARRFAATDRRMIVPGPQD